MLRTPLLIAALALFCNSLPAMATATPANRSLLIAQPVDLSGPNADFGRDYSLGAKVYFDHVNAGGGVRGRRINYRAVDTAGIPSQALSRAKALLAEKADVLFGVTGNAVVDTIARDSAIQASGVALFGAVGGNRLSYSNGVFQLRASISDELGAMVSQLRELGITSFGLVSSPEYATEAGATMNAEATKLGIRLLRQETLPTQPAAISTVAEQMATQRPQAVIVIGDTLSAAQFFKRYRSLDPGAFLCAPSLVNVRTLTAAIGSTAARGLIISQVVPGTSAYPELSLEHRRLMEKYADEPISPATLEGFISAKLLVQALQKAPDSSAAALRQALTAEGRISLGGYALNFGRDERASRFVELSVINREGRLMR